MIVLYISIKFGNPEDWSGITACTCLFQDGVFRGIDNNLDTHSAVSFRCAKDLAAEFFFNFCHKSQFETHHQ